MKIWAIKKNQNLTDIISMVPEMSVYNSTINVDVRVLTQKRSSKNTQNKNNRRRRRQMADDNKEEDFGRSIF